MYIPRPRKEKKIVKKFRINQEIKFSPLRVISADGRQLGVLSREEAQDKATEAGLDSVEVSPNARPPVVKIMDYGKFKYEQNKAERKQRQKGKIGELKEIRLGLKISEHDLNIKIKQAITFLKNKNKVQILLRFRGREITHKDLGTKLLNSIILKLEEFGNLDENIKEQRMVMIATILPK